MKRHASMPYGYDFQRVSQIIGKRGHLIEKNVPEASTGNDSDSHIEDQILNYPPPFSPIRSA